MYDTIDLYYIEELAIYIKNQFMKIIEKIYNWI